MSKRTAHPQYDYWDIIEAALTAVPETYRGRDEALAAFDHLKERVLASEPRRNDAAGSIPARRFGGGSSGGDAGLTVEQGAVTNQQSAGSSDPAAPLYYSPGIDGRT